MKTTKLLIITIMMISLVGCWFNNDLDEVGLPPVTQSGENTFGMLLDGEPWKPTSLSEFLNSTNVYFKPTREFLSIHVSNTSKKEDLWLYAKGIKSVGLYTISSIDESITPVCIDSTRLESNNSCNESFKLSNDGKNQLHITRLDTIDRIVSGTFFFDMINPHGETIEISEGRFDFEF